MKRIIFILALAIFLKTEAQTNTFPDNGNVGIGTTNPDSKLTVRGHVNIGGTGNYKLRTRHIDGKQTSSTSVDDLYLNYGTGKHVRVGYGGQDSNVYISGKVGIGTTSPTSKLTVNGIIEGRLKHKSDYFRIYPYNASYDDGSFVKSFYDGNNKQIRFWNSDTNTSHTRLETGGLTIASANPIGSVYGFSNRIEFIGGGHAAMVFHPGKPDELMFGMHTNGNFYWGTGGSATKPNYYSMFLDGNTGNLGIRGKLTSNEVKVKLGGWSDFVFESHYKLPTLQDVEQHIKDKGHLKDIPSAKEVAESGILLGEMNAKLLQKIEELTLYTIQQEKEIQDLKRTAGDNKKLNERLLKLEALLLK